MRDKICLITGATSGVGLETARGLARMGAVVVGVGRNAEKAERARDSLRADTGNSSVEFLLADLSDQAQVRRLAETFRSRFPRLDVLINNAGAIFVHRRESADGIEMTFALNHLAYFLLTLLLLDGLKASPSARVVNVSSEAHRRARLDLDDLQISRRYFGWSAYCRSKLGNVLFTYELSRLLQGTSVTANCLHPGFVASQFGRNNPAWYRPFNRLAQLFAISPQKGARTGIYLASSPELEGVSGGYFVREKAVQSSRASYNEALARRLWEVSEALTGMHWPGTAA